VLTGIGNREWGIVGMGRPIPHSHDSPFPIADSQGWGVGRGSVAADPIDFISVSVLSRLTALPLEQRQLDAVIVRRQPRVRRNAPSAYQAKFQSTVI